MIDLPYIKDTIVFEDRFLKKIKSKDKIATIRNSPVALGYKQIEDDLIIEVVSCEKVLLKCNNKLLLNASLALHCMGKALQLHNKMGFESNDEMYDFYENYLKRDFAYLIKFEVVEQ